MTQLLAFYAALRFLTVLPVPRHPSLGTPMLAAAMPYYPLVGLLIGAVLALAAGLTQTLAPALQAAIILALWVAVTGALHLDGLADSADGWLGGLGSDQRTLKIMRDPRCGTAAVVVVNLTLLLKFVALEQLLAAGGALLLLLVPALARAAVVLLVLSTPYARSSGLGRQLSRNGNRLTNSLALIATTLMATSTTGWWSLAITILALTLLRGVMLHRLGGFTGDTAGALIELVETSLLLGALIFA